MEKNQIITLTINDVMSDGNGVGRFQDTAIFVPFSVTGDVLEVKILKVLKKYCFGKIERIITPSPYRIEDSSCPVFKKCGGCSFRHIDYDFEVSTKNDWIFGNMQRIGKTEMEKTIPVPSVSSERYRNKAIYPIGIDESGNIFTGFYSRRSHRLIRIDDCPLHPEFFHTITSAFTDWANQFKVSVYDETCHKGLLRALYIRTGFGTGEVMVTIIANGTSLPHTEELIQSLKSLDLNIVSIVLNINKEDTNVLLGKKCITLFGKGCATEKILGNSYNISPLAFLQVNHDTCEVLYSKAIELAEPKEEDIVLDLYCGAGTIGLSIADKVKKVIGVEIIPEAVENAKENALLNGINNAEFICADAAQAARQISERNLKISTVIVDPPRKGLERSLIETISSMNPAKVVMISCDHSTAARDTAIFKEFGFFAKTIKAVDMFPRTNHVETVVLLSKLKSTQHIEVELDLDEMDLTTSESKATYDEIKMYVLENHSLKVSSLYISQVKRKCGLEVGENYNQPKSENSRQPKCPPEKEKAIMDALKHFQMI